MGARYPVVLDLETKHTFRQFSDPADLGISVAGIFDYKSGELMSFEEKALADMFSILENASIIVGFNIDSFDLPVLKRYYPGNTAELKTFDILSDIKRELGRRLSLNDVVRATLGREKSGHGLHAITLYNEGKMKELTSYCLDDVRLTKELFDYGVRNGEVFYPSPAGKERIPVSWEQYHSYQGDSHVNLTLPF